MTSRAHPTLSLGPEDPLCLASTPNGWGGPWPGQGVGAPQWAPCSHWPPSPPARTPGSGAGCLFADLLMERGWAKARRAPDAGPGCQAPHSGLTPPLPGQTEPGSPTRWSGLCPSKWDPRPHPPRPPRSSGPPTLTHRDPQGAPDHPPTLRTDQRRERVTAQARTRPWEARVGAVGDLNGWSHRQTARSVSAPLYLQAPAAGPTDRLQSSQAGPSNLGHPTPRTKRQRPQFCGLLGLLRPLNTPQGGTPRHNRS